MKAACTTLQEKLTQLQLYESKAAGRLSSLKTLQKSAYGEDIDLINDWLNRYQFTEREHLGNSFKLPLGSEGDGQFGAWQFPSS